MAINFGQYVYKPHQLSQTGLFDAVGEYRDARQRQQQLDETGRSNKARESENTATRMDLRKQFAARLAEARNDKERDRIHEEYQQQLAAIAAGRAASNNLDNAGARTAGARAKALGGTFEETPGERPGYPDFQFREGRRPNVPDPDVGKAYSDVYGGGNKFDRLPGASAAIAGPQAPTPQQTASGNPSPAPPGPPGSPLNSYAKDYDRQLQGSQTALSAGVGYQPNEPQIPMPQLQAPAPMAPPKFDGSSQLGVPEGPPQVSGRVPYDPAQDQRPEGRTDAEVLAESTDPNYEGPMTAEPGAPGTEQPPPTAPGEPPLTLRNPMSTPSFSPYSINTSRIGEENKLRLKPFQDAMVAGVGGPKSRFGTRMQQFVQHWIDMGYPPEKALELAKPYLEANTGLWRAELQAEGQAGALALREGADRARQEDRQFVLDQRARDFAVKQANNIIGNDSIKNLKVKMRAMDDVYAKIDEAIMNPHAANQVYEGIYYANNKGLMTDSDFDRQEEGVVSIWGHIKNRTLSRWLSENGGMTPHNAELIKRTLDIGLRNNRKHMSGSAAKLYAKYQHATNPAEKQEYLDQFITFFDPEYWPAELNGGEPGTYITPEGERTERAAAPPPSAGDNLGTAGVPKTLDGKPSTYGQRNGSYAGPQARSPRVPAPPPRKPPAGAAAPSATDMSRMSEDELMKRFEAAGKK